MFSQYISNIHNYTLLNTLTALNEFAKCFKKYEGSLCIDRKPWLYEQNINTLNYLTNVGISIKTCDILMILLPDVLHADCSSIYDLLWQKYEYIRSNLNYFVLSQCQWALSREVGKIVLNSFLIKDISYIIIFPNSGINFKTSKQRH